MNQTPHKPDSAWRASIFRPEPFAPRQTSLIVALLAAMALCGCQQGDRQPYDGPRADSSPSGAQVTAAAGPERTTQAVDRVDRAPTVEQVKEAPLSFYGKQVRLVGEVEGVLSDRSFELEGTGWAFGDNIIVLTKTPVQFASGPLGADSEVIVAGTVRRYVKQEIERDLGWGLTPELETRVKDRPVIVADTIRKMGDYGYDGRWSADGRAGPPEPVQAAIMIVTAADPDALAGQRVELTRERVQSVMGKGLWIGPGHMSQVFVLPATMPKDVQAGDFVAVSGVLRKVPKDASRTWDIPAEMAGVVREETLFIDASTVREAPAQAPR